MEENKAALSPAALKQALSEGDKEDNQISITEIINMMLAFWWLIALLAVLIGGATYTFSRLTYIPQYTSSGTIYIDTQNQTQSNDVNAVALQNASKILPTYIEVLKSTPFIEKVSGDIKDKYTDKEILKMISFEAVEGTNLINVEVKSSDAHDSYLIAKSIMKNAPSRIAQVFEGGAMKVIEYPVEAASADPDSSFKKGIVGFILGMGLAMLIIFLINLFDTRVKSSEELTNRYGLPILGEIPNLLDM